MNKNILWIAVGILVAVAGIFGYNYSEKLFQAHDQKVSEETIQVVTSAAQTQLVTLVSNNQTAYCGTVEVIVKALNNGGTK